MIVNSITGTSNPSFGAFVRVTPEAKNVVYNAGAINTVGSNLVLQNAMRKFAERICGQFPFAGNVFFDAISKKTKSLKPGTNSKYEMRIMDKAVDFHFDPNRIYSDNVYHNGQPLAQRIEQESSTQAEYLYNTYIYLRGLCGR